MTPLDTHLLLAGYLRAPNGRLNYIHGLEVIAHDILAAGAEVYWGDECMCDAGRCDCRRRRIILAPWLSVCTPWRCRDVLSHELGHAIVGVSDERCRAWQHRTYRDVLVPPWVV